MGRGALLVMLALLGGCGRLGFEVLHRGTKGAHKPRDAGADAAVTRDAGRNAGIDAGRAPAMDAATPIDAGADAGVHVRRDSGTDAAIDLDAGAEDAALDAAPPAPGTFCEAVHPLAAPPIIDGVLEPGLALRSVVKDYWVGKRPVPADHDAAYAVAYRSDGLYVFVTVTDPTRLPAPLADELYCGDGVEIYVDADGAFPMAPSYDVPGTVQFIAAAPDDAVTPAMRASLWNNVSFKLGTWSSTEFGTFPTPTGYTFEAMFRAADLNLTSWTLTPGNDIGLSLAIDVAVQANDPDALCGHRLGQYFNRVDASSTLPCGIGAYCTTNAFCSAPLQP